MAIYAVTFNDTTKEFMVTKDGAPIENLECVEFGWTYRWNSEVGDTEKVGEMRLRQSTIDRVSNVSTTTMTYASENEGPDTISGEFRTIFKKWS